MCGFFNSVIKPGLGKPKSLEPFACSTHLCSLVLERRKHHIKLVISNESSLGFSLLISNSVKVNVCILETGRAAVPTNYADILEKLGGIIQTSWKLEDHNSSQRHLPVPGRKQLSSSLRHFRGEKRRSA